MQTMNDVESGMDENAMQAVYARTLYSLRETRKALLRNHGVSDEAELLDQIRRSELPEHPSYEHYLGARIIEQTRQQLREELLAQSKGLRDVEGPAVSVHLAFNELLESEYGDRMSEPARIAQDALLLSFETGLMMEVRYFSVDEFSIRWAWGEAEFCLDTAPRTDLPSGPTAHLHSDDGAVQPLLIFSDERDCWRHFSAILNLLLVDPMLESVPPTPTSDKDVQLGQSG